MHSKCHFDFSLWKNNIVGILILNEFIIFQTVKESLYKVV